MKAVVVDSRSGHEATLRLASDYPQPVPPPGEARIRTTLVGICNTDLEVLRGYATFQGVPGHEFVGIVDQAEDPHLVGHRVVGEINAACGACPTCRAGHPTHCPQRTALGIRGRDGALAEYLCLPVANVHRVPAGLPDEVAVFTEPLAAACEILEQIHVHPTDRVVVLGDGKLGLLVAQVLALTGCDLLLVGHHPEKLAHAAARGIRVGAGTEQLPAAGADLVVECTGRFEGFADARRLIRPRGTLVLKSTYHGLATVDLSSLVVDEIALIGSRCGPFAAALHLLAQGLVDVRPLVDAVYPLDEALAALDHARRPGTLKVLVRP